MEKIKVIKGDITQVEVDAIVNAANNSLLGGGGVDGAIHRAGGPEILEACQQIRAVQGGCPTGEAVITTAGRLRARYVIHTVGPVWHGEHDHEKELLRLCYVNSLKLASEKGVKTIAFPNISTGVYRFPKDVAANIAVAAVRKTLPEYPDVEKILFVCFDKENYQLYQKLLSTSGC